MTFKINYKDGEDVSGILPTPCICPKCGCDFAFHQILTDFETLSCNYPDLGIDCKVSMDQYEDIKMKADREVAKFGGMKQYMKAVQFRNRLLYLLGNYNEKRN